MQPEDPAIQRQLEAARGSQQAAANSRRPAAEQSGSQAGRPTGRAGGLGSTVAGRQAGRQAGRPARQPRPATARYTATLPQTLSPCRPASHVTNSQTGNGTDAWRRQPGAVRRPATGTVRK
ncbi:Hypothetical predicted protein [Olea europaea subsp. europaea]|uniref:Uncharacterized protein n=1 Tax=Olea europaea subsp. europaea TaxID=158383 RepID=A0A8S0SDH0_OLEEU|nr:Hypothetical predicted protein [Olea europaea subsp. europaea]